MADLRALVITATGTTQRSQTGDNVVIGSGLKNVSGNLIITPTGTDVVIDAAKNLSAAAGAGAFDFSSATGLFKTSTGAVTIGGSGGAALFSSTTNSFTNALYAEGGVDRAGATVLALGTTNASGVSIGKAGANSTVNGSLIVTQNLTVSGTTSTINSTVVDIADRVVHFNNSTGANDPVPAAITGIAIHRGAVAGVDRDHAALIWDESNSRWNFAINVGGGDSTLGADQALKMGATTITAGLTQSGGAVSLTGNAASSFTTSSGALTLTGAAASTWSTAAGALTLSSAAAATWSTAAGVLTLNGTGGLNLQGGGTTALAVNSSGTALTVQAGATLATTGTGNVNLPQNASARFQIEGVATTATVTSANLTTLTNGSNADALHVHAAAVATSVDVTGLTTTGLANGDFGYISAANTLTKTNSDAIASSRVFGANIGTAGSARVAGVISAAKFTTIGGSPGHGSPVFLAPGTEEASASGKLTATAPATAGQQIAEVGLCLDNSGYAGAKTASILLQPKTVIQL